MKRMRLGLLVAMGLGLAACQQESKVADPASPTGEQGFATELRNKLLDAKPGEVIEAVSYTHLDVYKRQVLRFAIDVTDSRHLDEVIRGVRRLQVVQDVQRC